MQLSETMQRSCVIFMRFSPVVTSCIIIEQYYTQKIDIDIIYWSYSDSTRFICTYFFGECVLRVVTSVWCYHVSVFISHHHGQGQNASSVPGTPLLAFCNHPLPLRSTHLALHFYNYVIPRIVHTLKFAVCNLLDWLFSLSLIPSGLCKLLHISNICSFLLLSGIP